MAAAAAAGAAGPVVVDLRAVQSPDYRGRGIARRSYEEAAALERVRPDLVGAYLLDPTWPPPGALDELLRTDKLCYVGTPQAQAALEAAYVYHCGSPFELDRSIAQVRPPEVDRLGLRYAATLHDLIPLAHRRRYLAHPSLRRRYMARLEVVRAADAVLAVSAAAAADARRMLDLDGHRVHVVGSGVAAHFVPPPAQHTARVAVAHQVPGLSSPFVFFPGGNDPRKNADRLIAAFGALPEDVRRRFQLVVAGDLPEPVAAHYRQLAQLAGVGDRLVLTGFVSDETLVQLYQATTLVAFPSLAEGFGLPVAEALACGAVACVSDRPPLNELVPDRRARFDPESEEAIAATMARCLTDAQVRASVRADATTTVVSWDTVAGRVAAVLEALARPPKRPWRPSRRMAVVSPFPPDPTAAARYSARLVEAMDRVVADGTAGPALAIDRFSDGPASLGAGRPSACAVDEGRLPGPGGIRTTRDAASFTMMDGAIGGYDHVLYVLGNASHHARALAALRRRPGTVLAREVRLSDLVHAGGGTGDDLASSIVRVYPGLPVGLGRDGHVSEADAERYGLLLLKAVAAAADLVLVGSDAAYELATLDVGPELAERVAVVPHAVAQLSQEEQALVDSARQARDAASGSFVVSSFCVSDPAAHPEVVVEAVALLGSAGRRVECRLSGATPAGRDALVALARRLGVENRVLVSGTLERADHLALLAQTDVAVHLRDRFDGECSATVSECLCGGVPAVVPACGWTGELPVTVAVHVPRDCGPATLAAALGRLLDTPSDRAALGRRARSWAAERTFEMAARALLAAIDEVPPPADPKTAEDAPQGAPRAPRGAGKAAR